MIAYTITYVTDEGPITHLRLFTRKQLTEHLSGIAREGIEIFGGPGSVSIWLPQSSIRKVTIAQ